MTELTREEIEHIVGSLDDSVVVEILRTGATREELVEAFEWNNADDVLARELHREPVGRIAELCEILARGQEDEDGRGTGPTEEST